jgi:hypothetical protein
MGTARVRPTSWLPHTNGIWALQQAVPPWAGPPVRVTLRLSLPFDGAGASRCVSRPLQLPGGRADLPGIGLCLLGMVVCLLGLVLGLLRGASGLLPPCRALWASCWAVRAWSSTRCRSRCSSLTVRSTRARSSW